MSEAEEKAYVRGERAALVRIMTDCARQLGYEEPLSKTAALLHEIEQARAALRSVCAEHGDADFNECTHLVDIIENHLRKHLDGKECG